MTITKSIALEANSILIPPQLAAALGDPNPAIALQQIHYWLETATGKIIDGKKWIYNRLTDWLEQFPWLSEWKLRQAFGQLRDLGLLKFAQHDKANWKRIGYYTIDYERLEALLLSKCGISHLEVRTAHTSKCGLSTRLIEQRLSSETTSETTTNAAAFLESDQEDNRDISASLKNLPEATKEAIATEKDLSSAAPTEDEKIEAIEDAGVSVNPHLERSLLNFTLEQVKAAVSHYKSVKAKGAAVRKPAAWITDCLKGQWWTASSTPVDKEYSQAKPWLDWAINQGLIYASHTNPAITGLQGICVLGKATNEEFKHWTELAKIYPLPFC